MPHRRSGGPHGHIIPPEKLAAQLQNCGRKKLETVKSDRED